jgi:CrcB protein
VLFWIALGGALGSVSRYVLGGAVQKLAAAPFPVGTLLVNVSGCFLIGIVAQHYMNIQAHPNMRAALITGFCGGYTTFSAFSLEAIGLFDGGEYWKAAAYILLSVTASLVATFAGMAAMRVS